MDHLTETVATAMGMEMVTEGIHHRLHPLLCIEMIVVTEIADMVAATIEIMIVGIMAETTIIAWVVIVIGINDPNHRVMNQNHHHHRRHLVKKSFAQAVHQEQALTESIASFQKVNAVKVGRALSMHVPRECISVAIDVLKISETPILGEIQRTEHSCAALLED